MADNTILVGATVDLGAYKSGMADAVNTTETSMKEMSSSFERHAGKSREALSSIALASEETGVAVNRHVRAIIRDLPLLGTAFELAFPVIAAVALFEVLERVGEKIKDVITDTFIYTEEQKELDKAWRESQDEAQKFRDKIVALDEAFKKMGKTPFQNTEDDITKAGLMLDIFKQKRADLFANFNVLGTMGLDEYNKQLAVIDRNIEAYEKKLRNLQKQQGIEGNTQNKPTAEADIGAEEKASAARIALHRAEWTQIQALVKVGADQVESIETGFENQLYAVKAGALQQRLALAKLDPDHNAAAIEALQGQISALSIEHETALTSIHTKGIQDRDKADEASRARGRQLAATDLASAQQEINAQVKANEQAFQVTAKYYEGEIELARINEQTKEDLLARDLAQHRITQKQEIDAVRDAKLQELELELKYEQDIQALYDKGTSKWQEVQNKINKIQAQAIKVRAKAEADEAKAEDQSFKQLWSSIGNTFKSAVDGIIKGNQTIAQDFQNLYTGLLSDFANYLEQKAIKEITSAIESQIQQRANAASQIQAAAATGGAWSYADLAAEGPVGLAAAPGVAAATSSAIEAFDIGLFEKGGIVPMTGLAMLHAGETVIPSSMSGTGAGLPSGGETHLHVHYNVSAIDDQGVKEFFRAHKHEHAKALATLFQRHQFKINKGGQ